MAVWVEPDIASGAEHYTLVAHEHIMRYGLFNGINKLGCEYFVIDRQKLGFVANFLEFSVYSGRQWESDAGSYSAFIAGDCCVAKFSDGLLER